MGYGNAAGGAKTRFTDTLIRVSAGFLGLDWAFVPLNGNLIADPRIGGLTDSQQGLIIGSQGAGAKSDGQLFPTQLANSKVRGVAQFSRFDLVSEQGASSFCGPAVAMDNGVHTTCYAIILRNGQWRLSRILDGANTDLIAAAAFVRPCVLEIQVVFNTANKNTVTVLRNPTLGTAHGDAGDVIIGGPTVDTSAVIQQTGIPGFYAGCPSAGDSSQWRNFSGGIL